MNMKKTLLTVALGFSAVLATASAQAQTIEEIKGRGELKCGVSTGLPGFSVANDAGEWTGLDVEYCRALAAAILGDATKVSFTPLTAKERFTALQSGEIDVLSRNTTWTLSRDTTLGLNFVGVTYYDGQGFMVNNELGVNSAMELNGASFCIQSGTTTELNLADFFRANNMEFVPLVFDTSANTATAFETGRCDVLTSDQSQLYALRARFETPGNFKVLPEVISKEPLGPVVRHGDDAFFDVAKWTVNALLTAEELKVTSANVDEMMSSEDPNIKRLLGTDGDMGAALGLDNAWAANAIKQVGNYGEIFERTVGVNTNLGIARGQNALWTAGGLQYAPPIR
jgi:general L-amino acid transport system substrate-binding protein